VVDRGKNVCGNIKSGKFFQTRYSDLMSDLVSDPVHGKKTATKIIIGTRGSRLALRQSEIAAEALRGVAPELEVEFKIIIPNGDRDKSTPIPLDTIGKGWFSQEIEQELRDGTIDIAVHSLKDLLTELPKGLVIGAYMKREDPRDVLLTKKGGSLETLSKGAVIGTDSTRRQVQMLALQPDAVMKSIRGNVPNRVQKLYDEPYDAIILAAAGLLRLQMQEKIVRYFEPHEMTPAPGQGTIALEVRESHETLLKILSHINHRDTETASHIERTFSDVMGGGCKAATGAYAWRKDSTWHVLGMVQATDGTIIRETLSAPAGADLGVRLADTMLKQRAA
jgi:hydroxymethylbilane synthase